MKEEVTGMIHYQRGTDELKQEILRALKLMQAFNTCDVEDIERQEQIIRSLFGSSGKNISVNQSFFCDLGYKIHVGDNFYSGYNCTILDMAEVRIGNDCMIAPNVSLYTTGHSLEAKDRNKSGYAIPITIGDNVWIGGSSVILPGVTIGDHSVVAGVSVVTKSVPCHVVVGANPAKILKTIE